MKTFSGFPAGKVHLTPIPASFFHELMPVIDNLGELKVTLYAFWFLDQQEGKIRYIFYQDFLEDALFMGGLDANLETAGHILADGVERAVQRGSLLKVQPAGTGPEKTVFFLNSARGRAALKAVLNGEWNPTRQGHLPASLEFERPNIFKLYEENIGPLTPLIAETLREAEKDYPPDWIEEAIRSAVENNARSWRYVEAILRSRKERKRDETHQRDFEEDRRRYLEGDFRD